MPPSPVPLYMSSRPHPATFQEKAAAGKVCPVYYNIPYSVQRICLCTVLAREGVVSSSLL